MTAPTCTITEVSPRPTSCPTTCPETTGVAILNNMTTAAQKARLATSFPEPAAANPKSPRKVVTREPSGASAIMASASRTARSSCSSGRASASCHRWIHGCVPLKVIVHGDFSGPWHVTKGVA